MLVINGEADTIAPISQGMVFAAANEPKAFWPVHRAGHNDLLDCAETEYVTQLRRLDQSSAKTLNPVYRSERIVRTKRRSYRAGIK